MEVSLGRVISAPDVQFDDSTLYHQLLKIKPTQFAFEPAEQGND